MIARAVQGAVRKARQSPVLLNAAATIVLRGSTTAVRLLTLFFMASIISPADFGAIIFSITVVEMARAIADLGVDALATREFAMNRDSAKIKTFLESVFTARVLVALVAYLLLVLLTVTQVFKVSIYISLILGLLIPIGLWLNISINYFQGRLQTLQIVPPVLINQALTVLVFVVLVMLKVHVLWLLALLPLSEACNAAALTYRLHREVGLRSIRPRFAPAMQLLHLGLPIAATIIIVTIYTRLDVLVLANVLDSAQVAYYGIAFRVIEPFLLVASALAASIFSHVSALLAQQPSAVRPVLLKHGLVVLIYGIAACLTVSVVAPLGIQFYLPEYTPAIPLVRILSVALLFRILNSCLTNMIQAYGAFSWITMVAFWNLLAIAALLAVLVPSMGAVGAALTLLLVEALNTCIQLFLIRRLTRTYIHTLPVQG